jgi:hypothetical protein
VTIPAGADRMTLGELRDWWKQNGGYKPLTKESFLQDDARHSQPAGMSRIGSSQQRGIGPAYGSERAGR